ncbi:hypothetical protein HK104_007159 [Borealophlyctis nickersoniae]|nr:hypothetical protein HK104_007159 [Borealophlyctis nickersoniae]
MTQTENAPPRFTLPKVTDNPNGWGPVGVSEELSKVPYAPYSKADRVGKIADWTAPAEGSYGYDRRYDERNQGGRRGRFGQTAPEAFGSGTASAFAYTHAAEDEQSFSVVDRAAVPKKTGFKSARGGRPAGRTAGGGGGGGWQTAGRGQGGARGRDDRRGQQGNRRRFGYNDKPARVRDPSIAVGPDWKVVEELDFVRLNKLHYEAEEPEDLAVYGTVNYYDKSYDRVNSKTEKPLQESDRISPSLTTSSDRVLQDFAKKSSEEDFTVFATDTILAALMCATRSVYSWDLVVTKSGNKLFLDKRPGSGLDFATVNENAADPPMENPEKETLNTPGSLAMEATRVVQNFAQQAVRSGEEVTFSRDVPILDPHEPAPSAAFRYRKWPLGEGTNLVLRTQVTAAVHQPGAGSSLEGMPVRSASHPETETLLVIVKALNEFDSRAPGSGGAPDWRQKLDSQRGAVMATEIKNNSNKLGRWTVESILSGADQLRLGFISRANPRDNRKHTILGTTSVKPKEFASQMNVSIGNGWGIVKTFVDMCQNKLEDGKYVLLKDPNKASIDFLLHISLEESLALEEDDLDEGDEEEL